MKTRMTVKKMIVKKITAKKSKEGVKVYYGANI